MSKLLKSSLILGVVFFTGIFTLSNTSTLLLFIVLGEEIVA